MLAALGAGRLNEVATSTWCRASASPKFAGAWSNHRFPRSRATVVSAIENEVSRLFVLKPHLGNDKSGRWGLAGAAGATYGQRPAPVAVPPAPTDIDHGPAFYRDVLGVEVQANLGVGLRPPSRPQLRGIRLRCQRSRRSPS